jgi:hypothetical protein
MVRPLLNSAPLVGKRSALTAEEVVLRKILFTATLFHLALHRHCAPANDLLSGARLPRVRSN